MARPCKLTPEIQKIIGDNVALGLTYSLAAEAAGITYKTFNEWMNKGQTEKSGKYFEFAQHIKKCNAEGAKKLLERLNNAAEAGNCQVCMFILERRFPDEFGRRVYRKTNVVSENLNQNVEINIMDADKIREKILEKFALV
jgi:transposase